MTDKDFNREHARVDKLLKIWTAQLGLRWWKIHARFHRSGDRMDARKDDDGYCTVARTTVQWQYLTAHIDWDLSQLVGCADEKVESYVVHELCHVLVRELRCDGGPSEHRTEIVNHEERVVTTLASAFIWTRNAARDGSQKKKRGRK